MVNTRTGASGLLDQAGLHGLNRNPHALGGAVGQLDADVLQIRPKLAARDGRHVRADATALLALALAVDDVAFDGLPAGDKTNSCHGFSRVEGVGVKTGPGAKQGKTGKEQPRGVIGRRSSIRAATSANVASWMSAGADAGRKNQAVERSGHPPNSVRPCRSPPRRPAFVT